MTVLCGYFSDNLTAQELARVRCLHARAVVDTAMYDDGRLRITRPRPGWLRLAGTWDTSNHDAALAVLAQAVAAGDRELDVSLLQSITQAGMHAPLTGLGRVRLRRPNDTLQRLAQFLGTHRPPGTN